ncbi:IS3 family transposase [uncultured Dialister sp.]|jgi:putative transposase|uniref:IS3 family transposase n=2 Tax=uncultured Dialister sp. TaxID=278064 RepID=UPI0026015F81|nr:IS3 family transposase [uncultured Dialister sp.]
MIQMNSRLHVRRQCRLLKVNRSSLYYVPKPPDPEHQAWLEMVMQQIDRIHLEHPYMGTRKMVILLRQMGITITRKTVRRLAAIMGICAVYPKANLSKRNFKESIVPYRLRNYKACFPNQVWSIDITYIPMPHGHMYLTAIIDWYSRKILEYYLADTLDKETVIAAVKEAVARYGIPAIINSDQGSQFTSDEYKKLLKQLGITQSMDGRRRWADNIMVERWFRSLKNECIYLNEYQTPRELLQLIGKYVKDYNTIRPHEALEYQTPDEVYYSCFQAA